jgi:ubiquinone/menaquinone biosynthesis C-methylase UbiE
MYTDGSYAANNPTWHEEDALFKAKYIARMLERNRVPFQTVAEIGTGSGAILVNLRKAINRDDVKWFGYDIAPEPLAKAAATAPAGVEFHCQNLLELDAQFDVLVIADVIEHIPDYMNFAADCQRKATYKVYHIPLDVHAMAVVRDSFDEPRKSIGHLHYFTQRTALATLRDTGHELIDAQLTPGALELSRIHCSFRRTLANMPRRVIGAFSPSLATRLFGGWSLLVLAK